MKEIDPTLLIVYVYHLYMGLLSGGSIIAKKRKLTHKIKRNFLNENKFDVGTVFQEVQDGCHVTTFLNQSIPLLKKKMRGNIDNYTEHFSTESLNELIQESKKVFQLNNQLIKSVKGVNKQNIKLIVSFLLTVLCVYLLFEMLN